MGAPTGGAVWDPALGPDGGGVSALLADPGLPGVVYAGTAGGVFVSVDGGERWRHAGDLTVAVSALAAAADGTLVAGTPEGVFASRDGGTHWVGASVGLGSFRLVSVVATDPADPAVWWLAAENAADDSDSIAAVFRSVDGGAGWKRVYDAQKRLRDVKALA
jgi:photosystem II stability/assembly factor-like uncharacterized protein